MSALRRFLPDPFVLALLGTLTLATLLPARGVGATLVGWLATTLIVLLFFFQGAKLSRTAIVQGIQNWRLHAVVMISTFVMFPLFVLALSHLFPHLVFRPLWIGLLYLAALPSTVQSSIAFTAIARGNVAAAIATASASQIVGVFLTPVLVVLLVGARGSNISISSLGSVMLQVLLPFVVGHLLRPWIGEWVTKHKASITITDRGAILAAVYGAFSAAVIEGIWTRVQPSTIAVLIAVCCVILGVALAFTWGAGRALRFPMHDRITILCCGTVKSLVQGVPMARVLFAGPDVGMILLPVMIFHQIQLMACAYISQRYAQRQSDE